MFVTFCLEIATSVTITPTMRVAKLPSKRRPRSRLVGFVLRCLPIDFAAAKTAVFGCTVDIS